MTRALIDAEFHDTPIGRCVVVGQAAHERCPALFAGDVLTVVETCPNSSGCLTALNYHCAFGGPEPECACDEWQSIYRRRGFVRVVEVLPVVGDPGWPKFLDDGCVLASSNRRTGEPLNVRARLGDPVQILDLTASPGDVVLVTEPWCETCGGSRGWVMPSPSDPWRDCPDCAPSPVRVIHRDGVLGEVET